MSSPHLTIVLLDAHRATYCTALAIDPFYRLISRSTNLASASPRLMIEVSRMGCHIRAGIGYIEVANI